MTTFAVSSLSICGRVRVERQQSFLRESKKVGFPRDKGESGCKTVKVGHPNGAPQIPPLRFHGKPGQVAPVGMTNRRGLLKRGRQLLGAGRLFNRQVPLQKCAN
jgi:hypothetical protein